MGIENREYYRDELPVDAKSVTRTGTHAVDRALEEAAVDALHREVARIVATVENEVDALGPRRPEPEPRRVAAVPGAERHPMHARGGSGACIHDGVSFCSSTSERPSS